MKNLKDKKLAEDGDPDEFIRTYNDAELVLDFSLTQCNGVTQSFNPEANSTHYTS